MIFFLGNCASPDSACFDSSGFGIDAQNVFVDRITIDSIPYASGEWIWIVEGSISVNSKETTFQVITDRNPENGSFQVIQSKPPITFRSDVSVRCVCTIEGQHCQISWKTRDQFIFLKSIITSER